MRVDSTAFALANESPSKEPRYVVEIEFDTGTIHCTSHSDIPSVPGVVMEAVLREPAAISQRIIPDEGRSEIGAFNFTLVDRNSVFTEDVRDKLADGHGIRRRVVKFWCGHAGDDFTAFQLFQTQIVDDCSYDQGIYSVECSDITREQRKEICEPKFTTLRDNVSDTATTIPVYDTSAFEMVAHGSWWSDAPSSTVGYIKLENEIIRYTGKTADTFTGCTRGALNTKAVAHNVDAATSAERRTKVEEYIYIELPAVMMALAIMTGELHGTADTLPDHWHLGIDSTFIRESEFTGIGDDLWNVSTPANSLILRFEGLKKTDGKRFLEKEIYLLLGCFSPVYSDGTLGLRRHPALISQTAPVATLTAREIISSGALKHDLSGMHNVFRVNWNHDPAKNEFTRITQFVDSDSISAHGTAPLKEYSFRGLHGSRHTDAIVLQRLHSLRDAYAYPPQRITVNCFGSLSKLEIGDVVRLNAEHIRDFAGSGDVIDRAFVILQKSHRAVRNEVTLELFGSTARPLATTPGTGVDAPLPDGFYGAKGVALSTVVTMVGDVVQPGTYTLTGDVSTSSDDSWFYHLGDLTFADGANLILEENVVLAVRGHITHNSDWDGTGGGHAGIADAGTSPWDLQIAGTPGWVGHSRGWDGVKIEQRLFPGHKVRTVAPLLTRGANDAFPFLQLTVSGTSLLGLPSDLRGTGGPPGGRIIETDEFTSTIDIHAVGGQGGAGGAGLAIICRGMSLGASASITLNGANTSSSGVATPLNGIAYNRSAGGAGGPGSLLILLDGNALSVPDISGKFFALSGTISQPTPYLESREATTQVGSVWSGYQDPSVISGLDWSNAAHRIQYIPEVQVPAPDVEEGVPPPTNLAVDPLGGGNMVRWTRPGGAHNAVEVFASLDNDRTNAVKVGEAFADSYFHSIPLGGLRYYWLRARRTRETVDYFSTWEPTGTTSGVASIASPLDRSAIERITPDAEMTLSTTKGEFWDWFGTNKSLHATGGLVGGVLRITSDGSPGGAFWPVRQGGRVQVANGDSIQATIRWRRTVDYPSGDGVISISVTTIENDSVVAPGDRAFGEVVTIDTNGSALNEWVEATYTLSTDVDPGEYITTIQPFLDVQAGAGGSVGGEVEIDLLRYELAPNKFKALSAGLVPKPTASTLGTGLLKDDATFVDVPWLTATAAETAATITPVNYAYAPNGNAGGYNVLRVDMRPSSSSATNTSALQGAIDVMESAGGGVVWIPEGADSYDFNGGIALKDKVSILCAGPFATVLQCTASGANGFEASSALSGVMLANFRLLGTGVANASENGIEIVGGSSGGFPKLVLRNLLVSSWGNVGIYLENCWDSLIEACNASSNKSHGFHVVRSPSVGMHKNIAFQNEGHGFFIQRVSGAFFSGTSQENDLNGWRCETVEGCDFVTYVEQNGHSGSAATTAQFYLGQASGGFNASAGNKIHVYALGGAGSTSPTFESGYGVYVDVATDNEVSGVLGGHLTNDVIFTSSSSRNTLGRHKFLTGLTSDTPTPFVNNATNGTNLAPVRLYHADCDAGDANVGTGEDDLKSFSLPANTLWLNQQAIEIIAWGNTGNNTNNKQVKLYFGSTVLIATPVAGAQARDWELRAVVTRLSATSQQGMARGNFNQATIPSDFTAPAETLSAAVTIKCTGEGTNDADITQRGLIVRGL